MKINTIWINVSRQFIVCILLITVAVAESPSKASTIGVSIPLSGPAASAGTDVQNALNFANEFYFDGKYKFVFEDDRCDAKTGVAAAQKLTSLDDVKVVLGMICNTVLLPSAPIYEKGGVTVISTGATTGDQKGVAKGLFRLLPADQLAIAPLYGHIAGHHKKLAVLTQLDAYSDLMERTLLNINKSSTPPLEILTEQVGPESTDFRSILMKFKANGFEAIYLNALAEPGYIEMVKQAKELGITAKLYSSVLPASVDSRKALKSLDDGVVFTNIPLLDALLSQEGNKAYSEFRSRYGEPKSWTILTLLAIDSLRMVDAAVKSGKPMNEYLAGIHFPGLIGTYSFDSDGAAQGINYELQEIRNGKAVSIKDKV